MRSRNYPVGVERQREPSQYRKHCIPVKYRTPQNLNAFQKLKTKYLRLTNSNLWNEKGNWKREQMIDIERQREGEREIERDW